MLKIVLALAALLCSPAAFAQTTGRWYAGGSASTQRGWTFPPVSIGRRRTFTG